MRSLYRSRSNWLSAARIASWSRPLAEPRSRLSFSDTNGIFKRLKILEHRQEVFQIPADSIQGPADDDLEPRPTGVEQQSIETWPAVLCPLISSVYSA